MRMAEWKISTPTFQNAPPPLLYESILSFKSCNMDISCTGKPFLTLVIRFRRCESFLNGIFVSIFHTWRTYPRYSVWLARSDKNSATSRVPPGAPLFMSRNAGRDILVPFGQYWGPKDRNPENENVLDIDWTSSRLFQVIRVERVKVLSAWRFDVLTEPDWVRLFG